MPVRQPEKPLSPVDPAPMFAMGVVYTDHPDAKMCETATVGEGACFPPRNRYLRAAASVCVTLKQPLRRGQHRIITGRLLGERHVFGALHHYRVLATDGVVYLAPPAWLARASRFAVVQAGLTVPKDLHSGLLSTPAVEPMASSPHSDR